MFPQCSSLKVSLTWYILKNTELIQFPNGFFGDVGKWETHQGLLREAYLQQTRKEDSIIYRGCVVLVEEVVMIPEGRFER